VCQGDVSREALSQAAMELGDDLGDGFMVSRPGWREDASAPGVKECCGKPE
jgi:hypothetical protein